MRGFNNNCSDLAGVVLVFWVDGGLWEIYDHLQVASEQALLVSLAQADIQEVVTIGNLTVFTENTSED